MNPSAATITARKKSSHKSADPNCVEVTLTPRAVAVRDSTVPDGHVLSSLTFSRFLGNIR